MTPGVPPTGLGDLAGPASGVAAGVLELFGPVGVSGPLELPDEAPDEAPEVPAELLADADVVAFGVVLAQFGLGEAAGLLLGDALTVEPGLCDGLDVGLGLAGPVEVGLVPALAVLSALDEVPLDALVLVLADPEAGAELDALPGAHVGDGFATAAVLVAVPSAVWPRQAAGLLELSAGPPGATAPGPCPAVPLPAVLPPPPPLPVGWPDRTDELSWTMACRSGGTAAATPAANTAQAIARAGRSSMLTSQRSR